MSAWQLIRTSCYGMTAALLLGSCGAPASGALLANWTFEESKPASAGPHAPEVGQGTVFAIHGGASEYSSPTGNGSEHSFSSTGWTVGDFYQVNYPAGPPRTSVIFRFDMASNAPQPPVFSFQYSRNGVPIGPVEPNIKPSDALPNIAWNSATRQFSYAYMFRTGDLGGSNSFSFRLTCYDVPFPLPPDVNVRLDNISIEAVPEPASGLLAACAVVGAVACRRRISSGA